MSSADVTNVIQALMEHWLAQSAITTITDARIYQAYPQTQTKFPLAVLWDSSDIVRSFDQGQVTSYDMAPALELYGYDPNQLRRLQKAFEDGTNTASLSPTGFQDCFARINRWTPAFDKETKLHRRVATLRIYAQPA